MTSNTEPLVSLTRPSLQTPSIATAFQHALIDLPEDLPDGLHWSASAHRVDGQHGADIAVVLKVSDHLNGQVKYTRSYDAAGNPVTGWSVGVQGSVTF